MEGPFLAQGSEHGANYEAALCAAFKVFEVDGVCGRHELKCVLAAVLGSNVSKQQVEEKLLQGQATIDLQTLLRRVGSMTQPTAPTPECHARTLFRALDENGDVAWLCPQCGPPHAHTL
jgi:hypothetical protein